MKQYEELLACMSHRQSRLKTCHLKLVISENIPEETWNQIDNQHAEGQQNVL